METNEWLRTKGPRRCGSFWGKKKEKTPDLREKKTDAPKGWWRSLPSGCPPRMQPAGTAPYAVGGSPEEARFPRINEERALGAGNSGGEKPRGLVRVVSAPLAKEMRWEVDRVSPPPPRLPHAEGDWGPRESCPWEKGEAGCQVMGFFCNCPWPLEPEASPPMGPP